MKQGEKVRRLGKSSEGVVTVYTRLVDQGMTHIEWGVAYCPPGDNYVKELGLMFAKRSASNMVIYTPNTPLGRLIDIMVLVDIMQTEEVPGWAEAIISKDLERGVTMSAEEVRLAFNM